VRFFILVVDISSIVNVGTDSCAHKTGPATASTQITFLAGRTMPSSEPWILWVETGVTRMSAVLPSRFRMEKMYWHALRNLKSTRMLGGVVTVGPFLPLLIIMS